MLQERVHAQDRVVRLDHRCGHLRASPHCEGELGLFAGESKVGVGGEDKANAESWVGSWGDDTITSGSGSVVGSLKTMF